MRYYEDIDRRWEAELSLGLVARALAQSECKYGERYILERLKDIASFIGSSNLPSVEDSYNEAKEEEGFKP